MVTPEIENFIKELNQKIKTIETTLAAGEGRRDDGEAEEPTTPEID